MALTGTTPTLTAHSLTFEIPTPRDYANGGFGDLVAQCDCGAFEYVYSRSEGAYWHGLHRSQPTARPHFLLVESPMPEGWVESCAPATVAPVRRSARICPTCCGVGTVEAFGPHGGRFYHFGERAACPECSTEGAA